MCAKYTQSGNPLFIPETGGGLEGAARALYAFGRHDAIGFSPHGGGSKGPTTPDNELTGGYDLIAQLAPLIVEHQGNGTMSAVLLGPNDPPQKIQVGNYTLEASFLTPQRHAWATRQPPEPCPSRRQFSLRRGLTSTIAAGNGVSVTFSPNTPGPPLAGLATVEEGTFVNGRWVPGRRLAGDDTGAGGLYRAWLRGSGELRWPLGAGTAYDDADVRTSSALRCTATAERDHAVWGSV